MPRATVAATQQQPPAVIPGVRTADHRDEVSAADQAELQTGGRPWVAPSLPPRAQTVAVAVALAVAVATTRTRPSFPLRGHVLLHRHPHPSVVGMVEGHDVRLAPDEAPVLAPVAQLAARFAQTLDIGGDPLGHPLRVARLVLPVDVGHGPAIELAGLVAHDLGEALVGIDDHRVRGPYEADTLSRSTQHGRLEAQLLVRAGVLGHIPPDNHDPAASQGTARNSEDCMRRRRSPSSGSYAVSSRAPGTSSSTTCRSHLNARDRR